MAHLRIPRPWEIPERLATPESAYLNRRQLVRALGLGALSLTLPSCSTPGYKGAKSIVRIEFLADPPATFWNFLQPEEYGFYSNVNPKHPHPRWSQETENDLGTGARRPTRLYNGYASEVAGLYDGGEI